jgi:hypothetical protein
VSKPGHSLTASQSPEVPPKTPSGFGRCLILTVVFGAMVIALAFVMRAQIMAVGKKADAAKTSSDKALAMVTKQRDDMAGLVQSIGQALNTLQANGTLTPAQAAAIAAQVAAQQAAKGAAKAQAGTTPGIPGSRSGGGTSTTPGVVGSARSVAPQTTPPPHSSDTSQCLLTANLPPILRVDGTLCPG